MKKPIILVTNDDGITAPGIRHLAKLAQSFGDVYVVAPDKPQSGMGHAVTINTTLFCEEVKIDDGCIKEWSCSGTPADCVKIGINELLPQKPDLVLSGINHGANSAINVLYSGTMSAAIEAGIEGIPSIGFSLLDFSYGADFKSSLGYLSKIISAVLENGMPPEVVLNVNIPKGDGVKGIKICRQAKSNWKESFVKRESPMGKPYYWLTGEFLNLDTGPNTDIEALEEGYISVVPTGFDLTHHQHLGTLKGWGL
ncbi:MAG: 5'/3'-nucleotidase SurE [Flavobacteriaceae bacterium]|nr:MAG: 5'/3'-nucleotidase SurE [Flavobacteriaceae bacterium]